MEQKHVFQVALVQQNIQVLLIPVLLQMEVLADIGEI